MSTMATRRTILMSPDKSCPGSRLSRLERSSIGMTISLHIIVDSAIVSTMTMPVAAENPPK